jgi:GNAT superfamily N-acetyltransferase
MGEEFQIKTMNREEVDLALDWASREGWNPGYSDSDCFYRTDPAGFFIGNLDAKPVGCISAVSYENIFGFIGFYIVVPEYRGRGYGIQLWNRAMERLKNQPVGLDGVPEQQANYRKSGFRLAYSNIRFESPAVKNDSRGLEELADLRDIPLALLEAYDAQCFPASRTAFLKSWLAMPQSYGVGWIKDGNLGGYGVIRKCRRGYKIGPLFADDRHKAEALYLKLSSYVRDNEPVYLDAPEVNQPALLMAEKFGMKKVFGTARMYRGPEPAMALNKVYGITTFELG